MWIGLNPSVADEAGLDNTLTRIKAFCSAAGFNCFYMANLFALVSTDSGLMRQHPAPVGPDNDRHILEIAERVEGIVVCWGSYGKHMARDIAVLRILHGRDLSCLGLTREGFPRHPLYLPGSLTLQGYDPSVRLELR